MDRKWRNKPVSGGPRGPPCPFPAVWPCEAGCSGFPAQVASVPHPAPESGLSRPVWRVCGEGWENAGPPGEGADGEKKKVPDKAVAPFGLLCEPHRPATRVGARGCGGSTQAPFSGPGATGGACFREMPAVRGFRRCLKSACGNIKPRGVDTECLTRCACICG